MAGYLAGSSSSSTTPAAFCFFWRLRQHSHSSKRKMGMRKRRNSKYRRDVLLPDEVGDGDGEGEEAMEVPVALKTPDPVASSWNFRPDTWAPHDSATVELGQLV